MPDTSDNRTIVDNILTELNNTFDKKSLSLEDELYFHSIKNYLELNIDLLDSIDKSEENEELDEEIE